MVYTLRFFLSSKCSLIHNSNIFGSSIIHILYTGCAKIKKIIPAPKGLIKKVPTRRWNFSRERLTSILRYRAKRRAYKDLCFSVLIVSPQTRGTIISEISRCNYEVVFFFLTKRKAIRKLSAFFFLQLCDNLRLCPFSSRWWQTFERPPSFLPPSL